MTEFSFVGELLTWHGYNTVSKSGVKGQMSHWPTFSSSGMKHPEPSDCKERNTHQPFRFGLTPYQASVWFRMFSLELIDKWWFFTDFSSTHLPGLRMTVQLGQQSWLTKQRLGKRPTPTAWRPLWSLSVKPLQLIWGREKHLSHLSFRNASEEVCGQVNQCLPHQRDATRSPRRRVCSF